MTSSLDSDNKTRSSFFSFVFFVFLFSVLLCLSINKPKADEIRGVWIATVKNSNWPKTSGELEQKQELIKDLDLIKSLGINRVYFQIRPRCDALYVSEFWPWSKYLTGELGKDPKYDPLLFMREECKKRDIVLEAWINPFLLINEKGDVDASFSIDEYIEKLPEKNLLKYHKEWIVKYGNTYFLNPGEPSVIKIITNEVEYLVKRYNTPIHMDDYFYPYPQINAEDTYDKNEYELYGKGRELSDFRRENINEFLKKTYMIIKKIDKNNTLSVSPFAIWKNGIKEGGAGTGGLESYYTIYCDTLLWVTRNYVDYIIPQIYWHIDFEKADYKKLAKWWNTAVQGTNVKLLIGQAGYRFDENSPFDSFKNCKELVEQIKLNRKLKNVCGQVIFSLNCLEKNKVGISDTLKSIYA
ncbi:MAG: family 10 glycosylhydrolase [Candidatus Improbicoccus pseudotrichonymphae]|uniref:Family 10 glycosylhydrolase n=1 Tax=Candidatus Improbicoccus pseudotrichonymphae TaxID=3033792 RepID=A0AA48I3X5_9FIRM|nr:MAG: family 10 glycosylhydrolase [Candidatus Improbicoccus pseudotrichonymphae]